MKTLILTIAIILSQTLAISNSAAAEESGARGWVVKVIVGDEILEIAADSQDSAAQILEQMQNEGQDQVAYISFKRN